MEESIFDEVAAEREQLRILLDEGLDFEADGKKYHIQQPYLGTLDYLSREFLNLSINRDLLGEHANYMQIFDEQKRMASVNVKTCARIVAIAVLNSKWKIKLLTPWYAQMFLWSVKPDDLMKLTNIILQSMNLRDFTSSIALLSINRTTIPQAMEE